MKKLYCITCPGGCQLTVIGSGYDMIVEGNKCEKGTEFAKQEVANPSRTLTTTVRTKFPGIPVISVRTSEEIPRNTLMDAMIELSEVVVETELGCGDTLLEDIAGTGVSVIVTSSALMKLGAELENKNEELGKRSSAGTSSDPAQAATGGGIGAVRNPEAGVLDHLGAEAAGGFVGSAGEAVGVEDTINDEDEDAESEGTTNKVRQKGRPHIRK